MGHHHRKNRNQDQSSMPQEVNSNSPVNMDLSSMLGNLNLDNIDLSKIDFSKVQSVMDKIKLPENSGNTGNSGNVRPGSDPRIDLLNSLRGFISPSRARAIDNVTKLLQVSRLMSNANSRGR